MPRTCIGYPPAELLTPPTVLCGRWQWGKSPSDFSSWCLAPQHHCKALWASCRGTATATEHGPCPIWNVGIWGYPKMKGRLSGCSLAHSLCLHPNTEFEWIQGYSVSQAEIWPQYLDPSREIRKVPRVRYSITPTRLISVNQHHVTIFEQTDFRTYSPDFSPLRWTLRCSQI